MTHLTDEQFEDAVEGRVPEPEHVAGCSACRDRLAEQRAVRRRLRSSFGSIHAGDALAEQVRRSTRQNPPAASRGRRHWLRIHHVSRVTWAALAAAAAVLVFAVPAMIYLMTPDSAAAASAELARIHTDNLRADHEFYSDADPARLAEYLKTRVGFEPATPRLGQGMAMRGCCVAHFKNKAVGSYVVDTPRGPISIIVVPQTPEQLGMEHEFQRGGKTFWADTFAANNMVTVRIGGYSYCAVGEVPQDLLTSILLDLGLGN